MPTLCYFSRSYSNFHSLANRFHPLKFLHLRNNTEILHIHLEAILANELRLVFSISVVGMRWLGIFPTSAVLLRFVDTDTIDKTSIPKVVLVRIKSRAPNITARGNYNVE